VVIIIFRCYNLISIRVRDYVKGHNKDDVLHAIRIMGY
jgi:hypothetical protein